MRFGTWELVLVLAIILILFGVGKLPEVMKSMGKGLREFKDATKGDKDKDKKEAGGETENDKEDSHERASREDSE